MPAALLPELSRRRHERALARADRAALRAGAAVRRAWAGLLAILRPDDRPPWHVAYPAARELFRGLVPAAVRAVASGLADQARWAYKGHARDLARALPRGVLLAALARRRLRALREDLDFFDLLWPFRGAGSVSNTNVLDLLFPPPSEQQVFAIVFATGWQLRLASKLATPEALAQTVATGLVLGQSPPEIARQLLPVVQGVESAARRIARTEGLRVAGEMQLRCSEQLGDLVIGQRVRATLDVNTRPAHRARDGQAYYARPGPGQQGYDRMPRPPLEADGTVAWNCRCYLTPILREE